jgi:ribosomal protein S18 acetylase RimI-like enzyme
MVEQSVAMLEELWAMDLPALVEPPIVRELQPSDAAALQSFYNALGSQARIWFSPLGWNGTLSQCQEVCDKAAQGERYDILLDNGREIVGWAFLQQLDKPSAYLGIGIADAYCGKGLGKALMRALEDYARSHGFEGMNLIVVQDNFRAKALYERLGFEVTEPYTAADGREFFKMVVKW